MRRLPIVAALCAVASVASADGPQSMPTTVPAQASPAGVFMLYSPGDPISAVAEGVTINVKWSQVEPQPGVYDWSLIDAAIKDAGTRQIKLGINGGVFSPAWIYAAGAQSVSATWAWKWGPPLCSSQRFPLPWDSTFLAAWNRLTAAAGARYGNNPQVVAIAHSAIMWKDLENVLPTVPPTNCPHPIDPAVQWSAAGYTPDLVLGAAAQATAAYVAAFPTSAIVLETGGWAFPGADGKPDWTLGRTLAEQFAEDAGAHAMLENDGLTAGSWAYVSPVPDLPLGLQAAAPLTGSRTCQDNGGTKPCPVVATMTAMLAKATAAHAPFIEFYPGDINNPELADVLRGWKP